MDLYLFDSYGVWALSSLAELGLLSFYFLPQNLPYFSAAPSVITTAA